MVPSNAHGPRIFEAGIAGRHCAALLPTHSAARTTATLDAVIIRHAILLVSTQRAAPLKSVCRSGGVLLVHLLTIVDTRHRLADASRASALVAHPRTLRDPPSRASGCVPLHHARVYLSAMRGHAPPCALVDPGASLRTRSMIGFPAHTAHAYPRSCLRSTASCRARTRSSWSG